jgi:hypothetical protein
MFLLGERHIGEATVDVALAVELPLRLQEDRMAAARWAAV